MEKPDFFTNKMSDYLCQIRDIGNINMYASGASLGRKFCLTPSMQKAAVLYWMSSPTRTETIEDTYPLIDWQEEVANGDTKLGYEPWTEHRQESAERQEERDRDLAEHFE